MAFWQKSDPALTYLNSQGYNVIRYPSAKLQPLGVIGRAGTDKKFLGRIDKVWTTTQTLPAMSDPEPVPGVAGSISHKTDLSFGLNILANALAIFGASAPNLELSYKNAQSVQFTFGDVKVKGIELFDVGDYLAKGSLRTDNLVVKRYISNEDSEMLLITQILQAESISVTAKTGSGEGIDLDLPAIEGLLGAKVGVKASASGDGAVTYQDKEGRNPLPIGFQAFRLIYQDGLLDIDDLAAGGSNAFSEDSGGPTPVVFADEWVDLDFEEVPV